MDIALSDSDIKRLAPNLSVILYDQLNHQDIHIPVVILYQTSDNYGHWVLLHDTVDNQGTKIVEFFDSYSGLPDSQFTKISQKFQRPHWLTKLLDELNAVVPIHYNDYPLQGTGNNIATCGKWCILRDRFDSYTIDQFAQAIAQACDELHLTPDQLVTQLIS